MPVSLPLTPFTFGLPLIPHRRSASLLRLQRGDHTEVFERGGVALHFTAGSDFLQNPPHYFSAACLRKSRGKTDRIRFRQRADLLPDVVSQLLLECVGRLLARLERHENTERLTLEFVRTAYGGGFRHRRMRHERAFNFCGADSVA